MGIIARRSKSDYKPAPEGLHPAVCVDVVDLGMKNTGWGEKHKARIRWQVEPRDEDGKRFRVQQDYTLSLHEKANLTRDLESWRGRKFTEKELEGFDLDKIVGKNCQVQVVHNLGKETVWANVQAIVPVGKGMVLMQPEDYVREKDRAEQKGTDGEEPPEHEPEDVPF